MSEQRPRLLIRPGGLSLDSDQLQWLRKHFEIIDDGEADLIVSPPADIAEPDPVLDQIRQAGEEMINLSAEELAKSHAIDRLRRVERIATRAIRDIMGFPHFEVRLTNPRTKQLEIVVAVGIDPLGVGLRIYALPEKNGISGYVATAGETYLCRDVRRDPRYTTGIDNARSSLTVPLRLNLQTIGVLNIESEAIDAFSDADVRRAELVAQYLAFALHLLNLLVAERANTRTAAALQLLDELREPLRETEEAAGALRGSHQNDGPLCERCTAIEQRVETIRHRIEAVGRGPSALAGMEGAIAYCERTPEFRGKNILVVDDDPVIRKNITDILLCAGCNVSNAETGAAALGGIETADPRFDVVITDVKLPDLTGFEIYTHVHENHPTVGVILMTGFGYDPHHSVVRASQQGLDSILFKPFKARQLLDEIRRALLKRT